jgi:hypothetical protein
MMRSRIKTLLLPCAAVMLLHSAWAADPPAPPADPAGPPTAVDIAKLKAQLDEQQKLIEQLRAALATQQKMLEQIVVASTTHAAPERKSQSLGETASAVPMILPAPVTTPARAPLTFPDPLPARPAAPQPAAAAPMSSPLQIRLGDIGITPVGFMDATAFVRDKNPGSGIGSSFGSIPYNTGATGKLSEFRFSPQNSRIGFRVDGEYKGARFIGYNEFDFLGTSGSNAIGVSNGGFVPRLRLFWVDVRKDQFEILAGQSWSMLTPNRKGISALPGDVFFSQTIDVNYMAGLTWTRQPGVRFLYHPNDQVTVGLSLENPNQYIGGSAGGSSIVFPAALTGLSGTQFDNGLSTGTNTAPVGAAAPLATPNLHPDIILKLAFDPNPHVHFEVAGIERTFKDWNITTGTPTSGQRFTKVGAGGSVNGNFEITKGFRLITNNYWSDGGGRYLFGQAPDLVVRSDGSISPIHSGGAVEGFEWTVGNTLVYGYYGGIYIGRNVALDANGTTLVGYGYRGSANSQNRAIQEGTIGLNRTIWKDPKYGALNFMAQYEYLTRDPWSVIANAAGLYPPKATHDNTVYLNLRYTLPGAPPPVK